MVVTTRHGRKRLRKRAGVPAKAAAKMARRAFANGITRRETYGELRTFLDNAWCSQRNCNNMRIYGSSVYMFSGEILVTVLTLPGRLQVIANEIAKRKAESKSANADGS